MSVGIAFSGGGVSAAIGAACAWDALVESYPSLGSLSPPETNNHDVTVSTVSGGSIGYGLWVNAKDNLIFRKDRENITMEDAAAADTLYKLLGERFNAIFTSTNKDGASDSGTDTDEENETSEYWTSQDYCKIIGGEGRISVGKFASELFSLAFLKNFLWDWDAKIDENWWTSIIRRIFDTFCVGEIRGGNIPWILSFGVFDQTKMTEKTDSGTLLPSSAKMLHNIHVNMTSGGVISTTSHNENQSDISSCPSARVGPRVSILDSLSFSSAFWAALILSSNTSYFLFKGALLKAGDNELTTHSSSEASIGSSGYIVDGGVIDTTGIIGLLHEKKDHIIAFYNNNVPLHELESPIAYLFGVKVRTDAMNCLKGPELTHVFPSYLYPGVITNLTDQSIGFAHLQNVQVVSNKVDVPEYVLSNLIIFSNGRHKNFFLDLEDERIENKVSNRWPDDFSFGLSALDANLLCAFNDWKVQRYQELLSRILT